jgi:hypothetical protein
VVERVLPDKGIQGLVPAGADGLLVLDGVPRLGHGQQFEEKLSREGRMSIDEYGDRVTSLNEARTRADLLGLFDDLPEPRPRFAEAPSPAATPGAAVAVPPESGGALPEPHRPQTLRQRLTRLSVPVGAVTAVGPSPTPPATGSSCSSSRR